MAHENHPVVFISYSHDSEDHAKRVLNLSEHLRKDGIETILDQYFPSGSPPEGWPRWMMNGLEKATRVLCVCTETYYRRFRGHEVPDTGRGVDWEGAIITGELYDARTVSNKFIPVLFTEQSSKFIPEPMRGQTRYLLDTDAGYQKLYNALLMQSGVKPAPLGALKRGLQAVHKWSEEKISTAVPASLILQTVIFALAAVWCLQMRMIASAAVCFVMTAIFAAIEILRRRGLLPASVGHLCQTLWDDNQLVKKMSLGLLFVAIVTSFSCTFVLIESLPSGVDAIEVTTAGQTTPRRLSNGNRQLFFCPPWGKPLTIVAPKQKSFMPVVGPWRPLRVSSDLFVQSVRIMLQCSEELRRILPGSPDEPKAAIKIAYDQRELFSGEFSGKTIVLTNESSSPGDSGSPGDSNQIVSEPTLSIPGQLKIEVFNAAGVLMVGPLEFSVADGQTSMIIPEP